MFLKFHFNLIIVHYSELILKIKIILKNSKKKQKKT